MSYLHYKTDHFIILLYIFFSVTSAFIYQIIYFTKFFHTTVRMNSELTANDLSIP